MRRCSASTASASGRRPSPGWRRGNSSDAAVGDRLPALAGPALLGVHLLHRIQGELRRVQADGPRALRRAELRSTSSCDKLIDLKDDGTFRLNMEYFDYCTGLTMTSERVRSAVRRAAARAGSAADAARKWTSPRSIQEVTEEVVLRLARTLHERDRRGQPLPRGRRRAELRGQRPPAARGAIQADLGPAGRRAMPAARWARRWRPGTSTSASRGR